MEETNKEKLVLRRGDIIVCELCGKGSQQKGVKYALVYSNNTNNNFSTTINVIPFSTSIKPLCTHVRVESGNGLKETSVTLAEQITTINKFQVIDVVGSVDKETMRYVDRSVDIQLGKVKKPAVTKRILNDIGNDI